MQKSSAFFIFKSFLIWRIAITLIAIFAIYFIPRFSDNFFGGRLINYETNPLLWGWANFDGEHYLSIAINGYKDLQQAYFPLYPLMIRLFGGSIWSGILISNFAFLVSLFGLYKLIRLDYSEKTAKLAIILLLVFPTSFFFATVYTESLFLALVVWAFYFFRKQNSLGGLVLGTLSSLTRAIGIIPIGLFSYMTYSKYRWGDYLAFFHNQTYFGEHRSNQIILLPQVFYRYLVKIIPNLSWGYFPAVFTTFLEITVAILFLILIIFSFKKIRLEYWIFVTLGYVLPTLSGSFSSLPRYVLVLFPLFIFMSQKLINFNKFLQFIIYTIFILLLIISESFYFRGYFVS